MKILIISHKLVFPTLDGGSLATKKIFLDFKKEYKEVDIVALKTKKEKLPVNTEQNKNQTLFTVNTSFNFSKLIMSFLNKKCYQVDRFYSKKISEKIIKIINKKKYDCVFFEGVFPSVYLNDIKLNCNCKTIIRTHNVEHEIWGDLAKNTSNLLKKITYLFLKNQMKKWEDFICSKCDFLFCVSKIDQLYFKKKIRKKIGVLPVSFKLKKRKKPNNFSIFHLGSMDWKPNIEGINWFLKKVWTNNLKKNKSLKFYLAGKNMPVFLKNKNNENLIIEGVVKNAESYMKQKSVMIVPLFSGSGIRIKILEGMSMGIPIISTSKGAQGIEYVNKKNILICDNEFDFIKSIKKIQKDKNLFDKISKEGEKLIKTHFSSEIVIKNWKNLIYENSYNNTKSS